jgi:lysyl-tRNA synthetase class 2
MDATILSLPMEIYVAYKDYNWMMEFTENLLEHCCERKRNEWGYLLVNTKLALKPLMLSVTMTDSIKHRFWYFW